MFANIRNAIASMIAVKAETVKPLDPIKVVQFQPHDRTVTTKSAAQKKANFEGITGSLDFETIKGLSSDGLRKQLVGKAVFSYVAKGFNEFIKAQGRYTSGESLDKALNHAAEACAQSEMMGFSIDWSEERWSFLLTSGLPAKLNPEHAKLVADITGQSVDVLIKQRDEKRLARYNSNSQALTIYLNAIQSYTVTPKPDAMGEEIPEQACLLTLSGASVMSALASYIEFVTTWTDSIKMAAELLLIKADQAMIERALARADRREQSQAPDYVRRIDEMLLDSAGMAAGAASGK